MSFLCFALLPETRFLQSLKLEGFKLDLIILITSGSAKPVIFFISSNEVLSHQAISIISLTSHWFFIVIHPFHQILDQFSYQYRTHRLSLWDCPSRGFSMKADCLCMRLYLPKVHMNYSNSYILL